MPFLQKFSRLFDIYRFNVSLLYTFSQTKPVMLISVPEDLLWSEGGKASGGWAVQAAAQAGQAVQDLLVNLLHPLWIQQVAQH